MITWVLVECAALHFLTNGNGAHIEGMPQNVQSQQREALAFGSQTWIVR